MTAQMTWRRALSRLALIASSSACETEAPVEPQVSQYVIEALSPTRLQGIVGATVQFTPIVRVSDRSRKPVAGVHVTFLTAAASGGVRTTDVITDSEGIASPGEWQLGTRSGLQRLRASLFIDNRYPVLFEAEARAASPFALKSMEAEQAGFVGEAVNPPAVRVVDRFDNGVEGVAVSFTVVRGGGSLEKSQATTSPDGLARAGTWVLGKGIGTNEVTASVVGFDLVSLTAQAIDRATVRWYVITGMHFSGRFWQPQAFFITRSVIALTVFDDCQCSEQSGYFIEESDYVWPPSNGIPEQVRRSGRYTLIDDSLTVTWGSTAERGQVAFRQLRLWRVDYDGDWFGWRTAIWEYVPLIGPTP